MLTTKHKIAIKGLEEASSNYEELSASLNKDNIKKWTKDEVKAQRKGGDALCIYEVTVMKGIFQFIHRCSGILIYHHVLHRAFTSRCQSKITIHT